MSFFSMTSRAVRSFNPYRAAPAGPALSAALAALVLSLSGCGTDLTPGTRLDMVANRTASISSKQGVIPLTTAENSLRVGDDFEDSTYRTVVSISLGAIPAGSTVTKVVLHMIVRSTFGDAVVDFGSMTVEHPDLGSSLGGGDFNSDGEFVGSIATIPQVGQQVDIDVTAAVQKDLAAGKTNSSFRFKFSAAPNFNSGNDIVTFLANINDPNQQPFATATIGS